MAPEPKDFHDSIPDNLTLVYLSHGNAFDVRGRGPVQLVNHVPQFGNIAHTKLDSSC